MAIFKNNPTPIGCDYYGIVGIADTIARQTGLRSLREYDQLVKAMGGQICRVKLKQWTHAESKSLVVLAPQKFIIYLPQEESDMDKLLIACGLGHYIMHAKEGRDGVVEFSRFSKDSCSLEALWFGMAVLIPDEAFILSEKNHQILDDQTLANLFDVPTQVIQLKRKLVQSAIKNSAIESTEN
jgi:Zn-dependent peptidase ImmA (M78 family)